MITLPAELLSQILHTAQAELPLSEQLQVRRRFERVCKAWYTCDNKWRIVSFETSGEGYRLFRLLEKPPRIERVVLFFEGWFGPGKAEPVGDAALDVRSLGVRVAQKEEYLNIVEEKMVNVIAMMRNVESIEIFVEAGSDQLTSFVAHALARPSKLEHITIKGPQEGEEGNKTPALTMDDLDALLPHANRLESLAITNCNMGHRRTNASPQPHLPLLRSLELTGNFGTPSSLPSSALTALMPSLRALTIDARNLFEHPATLEHLNSDSNTLQVARGLRRVRLTDKYASRGQRARIVLLGRGCLDNFVAALESVTRLEISTIAVSDLGTLAQLNKLQDLTLCEGYSLSAQTVESDELLSLVRHSRSLERLTIDKTIAAGWPEEEVDHLTTLARDKAEIIWA